MVNKTTCEFEVMNSTITALELHRVFPNEDAWDKHEFITLYPWTAYSSILIVCLASLFGTAGNVLTVLAIAVNKNIRNVESVFFLNLAVSDLYVTAIADPLNVVGELLFLLLIILYRNLLYAFGNLISKCLS